MYLSIIATFVCNGAEGGNQDTPCHGHCQIMHHSNARCHDRMPYTHTRALHSACARTAAGTVITRTRPEPMNAERGPHSSNAVVIGWSELHQLLLDRLPHDTVVYGATLASYKDEADCVRLEFQDGRSISAKVLLACDGPNSDVRAQCINDGEPLFDVSAAGC